MALLGLVTLGADPEASAIDMESVAQRLLVRVGAKEAPCPPVAKSLRLSRFLVCGQLQVDPTVTAKEIDRALSRDELGVAVRPMTNWTVSEFSRSRYFLVDGSPLGVAYEWSSSSIMISYPRPYRRCEGSREELQAKVDACQEAGLKKAAGKFPHYPESARKSRINGQVQLAAVVDVDGLIKEVCVMEGTRDGKLGFEQASIEVLGTWRYTPAMRDGKPVECTAMIIMDFFVQ